MICLDSLDALMAAVVQEGDCSLQADTHVDLLALALFARRWSDWLRVSHDHTLWS